MVRKKKTTRLEVRGMHNHRLVSRRSPVSKHICTTNSHYVQHAAHAVLTASLLFTPLYLGYYISHKKCNAVNVAPVDWQSDRSSLTIGLVAHSQDNLWCSVVACNHIWCHQETCGCRPSQAKVQNLQRAVWLDNYITGLEVLQDKTDQMSLFWSSLCQYDHWQNDY